MAAALPLVLSGCGEGTVADDPLDAGPAGVDAAQSSSEDAGAELDSGVVVVDAGEPGEDAGAPDDAGTQLDAGAEPDAGLLFKVPGGDLCREPLALGAEEGREAPPRVPPAGGATARR